MIFSYDNNINVGNIFFKINLKIKKNKEFDLIDILH